MPAGAVHYSTYASGQVPDENEFMQRWVNPNRLRPGPNYLAVEIHNSSAQSMDIGFDLALVADIPTAPPKLGVERLGSDVVVRWPRGFEGYKLESAAVLPVEGLGWETVTNQPPQSQGDYSYTNRGQWPTRFFRLKLE